MQPKLKITSLHGSSGSRDYLTVSKTNLSIPIHFVNRMGLQYGEYIQTAVLGTNMFIAKRPRGMFGGYKLQKSGKGESGRLMVTVKPETIEFIPGQFKLSEKSFVQEYDGEFGKKISIEWWTLEPV